MRRILLVITVPGNLAGYPRCADHGRIDDRRWLDEAIQRPGVRHARIKMTEHFCTYFDHRYAAKGLAMWRSLKREYASANLHVLCLDDACHEILATLALRDVYLYPLKTIEDVDSDLRRARIDRTLLEYYFTLTPSLPLYLFRTHPEISRLTYVDADIFFFADPQPILDELGDASVGVIEHRFPDAQAHLDQFGRFNVGWLTFHRDPEALNCLETWRQQCLEWCYDRVEPGRFAEQKYLDEWPERFPRTCIIQHNGANLAPWNLNRFELSLNDRKVIVSGQPLIFFHAHGFVPNSPGRSRELNLGQYGVEETTLLVRGIFEPYEKALVDAVTEICVPLALALLTDEARNLALLVETLRAQLTASEADRANRLEVIDTMQKQLDTNQAEQEGRLRLIYELQTRLEAARLRSKDL